MTNGRSTVFPVRTPRRPRGDRAGARVTRTASSPRRGSRTRRSPRTRPTAACAADHGSSTRARRWCHSARRRRSPRSSGSVARRGGTRARSSGVLEVSLDVLVGGPGLRRGRRDPVGLRVGDTIDFWRVEAFEPDRLLRLHAEMKVPGRAWLQFEVSQDDGRLDRDSDRDLRSHRALRPRLLVRPLAVPRLHLRRHAQESPSGDGRPGVTARALRVPGHAVTQLARRRDTVVTGLRLPSRHGGGAQCVSSDLTGSRPCDGRTRARPSCSGSCASSSMKQRYGSRRKEMRQVSRPLHGSVTRWRVT